MLARGRMILVLLGFSTLLLGACDDEEGGDANDETADEETSGGW